MEGAPIDLTEERLKRKFIEIVNDHIYFYNECPAIHKAYHQNAIASHQTTATVFGWDDVAKEICDQCNAIWADVKPNPISI